MKKLIMKKLIMKSIAVLLTLCVIFSVSAPETVLAAKKHSCKGATSIRSEVCRSYSDLGDGTCHTLSITYEVRCSVCNEKFGEHTVPATQLHQYENGMCKCKAVAVHECMPSMCVEVDKEYRNNGDGSHVVSVLIGHVCSCGATVRIESTDFIEGHGYNEYGRCVCGAIHEHVGVMTTVVEEHYTDLGNASHRLTRLLLETCICGEAVSSPYEQYVDYMHDTSGVNGSCSLCGHVCGILEKNILSEDYIVSEEGHRLQQDIENISCCGYHTGKCVLSDLEKHSYKSYFHVDHPHNLVNECSVCKYVVVDGSREQKQEGCPLCDSYLKPIKIDENEKISDVEEKIKYREEPEACVGEGFIAGALLDTKYSYYDLDGHIKTEYFAPVCSACGEQHVPDNDDYTFLNEVYEGHVLREAEDDTKYCVYCGENMVIRAMATVSKTVVSYMTAGIWVPNALAKAVYDEWVSGDATLEEVSSQVVRGNACEDEDISLSGTLAQILVSFTGADAPVDINNIFWDIKNFDEQWEKNRWNHLIVTVLDMAAVMPIFGGVKSLDEAALVLKKSDEGVAGTKGVLKESLNSADDIFIAGKKSFDKLDIENAYVKTKHLSTTGGNGQKFIGESKEEAENILKDVLSNGKIISISDNGFTKMGNASYEIIIDAGKTIGTKGENLVKIVISSDGGMLTAYPIK